ncbi:mediator complex, subunit Med11 [Daldinia caldariorum]|uniref:mediator complex, subunit Med11 n=1 Tax=Daldinia caldariorum TaxID=326644 RepID=UPI0020079EB2|nr:mediator complex, subunit Med11 [Daldinia caldariorum]KAI1463424.1 mediator complex, subunit Med11 [Daldinia caldariorum]
METDEQQSQFVPFTKAERIEQLAEIDRNIVSLLRSTARAIQTLGKQQSQSKDAVMTDDKGQESQVFQDSMNDFLRALRTVNVGMKRQIWGLEEEHIISLENKDGPNIRDEAGEVQGVGNRNTPIQPDGDGKIGGLDVGWLNSRSDEVERGMETDLWAEAEAFLRRTIEQREATKN